MRQIFSLPHLLLPSCHLTIACCAPSTVPAKTIMFFCHNPYCLKKQKNTSRLFPSSKSLSSHFQSFPTCKAFFMNPKSTSAPTSFPVPSKRASINTSAHLFKKQRLRLNPVFPPQVPANNNTTSNHRTYNDGVMPEFDSSFSDDDNADQSVSLENDDYITSNESQNDAPESLGDTFFVDDTEPPVESGYSCFTTSQKCVTSLMYLLDAMECPDYGFKSILEWARGCFEAGFDFNPKCKTRLGNLNWMYASIHNAEQMLPHLEPIDLLPNLYII